MPNATAMVPKKNTDNKNGKVVKSHPSILKMVNAAIQNLHERGGSSLHAIKKYMTVNFMVDAEKLSVFIKKYIKAAVSNNTIIQTKGQGASGSFKLASSKPAAKKPKSDVKTTPSKEKNAVAPSSSKSKSKVTAKSLKISLSSDKSKVEAKSTKKTAVMPTKKSNGAAAPKTKTKKVKEDTVSKKKVTVLKPKSPLKAMKSVKVSAKQLKDSKSPIKKSTKKVVTKKN